MEESAWPPVTGCQSTLWPPRWSPAESCDFAGVEEGSWSPFDTAFEDIPEASSFQSSPRSVQRPCSLASAPQGFAWKGSYWSSWLIHRHQGLHRMLTGPRGAGIGHRHLGGRRHSVRHLRCVSRVATHISGSRRSHCEHGILRGTVG